MRSHVLKREMEYCELNPEEVSKTVALQQKVDEVKGIMIANLEEVRSGRGARGKKAWGSKEEQGRGQQGGTGTAGKNGVMTACCRGGSGVRG